MKELFDLTGKTAIVTGGGSGIGRAIAIRLAKQGATVSVVEVDESNAAQVVDAIKRSGGNAQALKCDVSNYDEVADVFERATGDNSLDILINSAGVAHIGTVEATTEEDFDKVYKVNVKGVFNCLKRGVSLMKAKGGSIINMASVASVVGVADRFAYSMSKGAVYTMTLSVAKDYLKHNIRCNCIAPARIHTPFVDGFIYKNYPGNEKEMFDKLSKTQPLGRMGTPDEVAALALYLSSDEAAFITGTCYPIDGGFITLNT